MNNVMLDLETIGRIPGASVVSIGAVFFDEDRSYVEQAPFAVCIQRLSSRGFGLWEDPETLEWWATQPPAVRQILDMANDDEIAVRLPNALNGFADWFACLGEDVRVWGNGADFDLPILAALYAATGQPVPWKPYMGRCYRTLKNLRRDVPLVRVGSHHNAVDDAFSQAYHAIALFKALRPRPWWVRLGFGS
jgi:3' exoribonuclease, RNase T-like